MALDLTCFETAQAKRRAASSSGVGWRLGDGFEVGGGDPEGVGVLEEEATGDLFEGDGGGAGGDFDEAQVLFGGKAVAGFGGEGRGDDGFDEELGYLLGSRAVYGLIDADDAAEGGDGVCGEGLGVGLEDGGGDGGSAGVGVLDDGDGGGGLGEGGACEVGDEVPAGVEVDEVVEGELFASELVGGGDTSVGGVDVDGGLLVGIFAVAEGGGAGVGEAEVCGELFVCGGCWDGGFGREGGEGLGDGGVVGGGGGEGSLGEAPAGGSGELAGVGVEFGGEGLVVGGGGDDGDVFEVFRGGADHGGAADVDVFDDLGEGDAGLLGGGFEGVEVDDDHVDGLDRVGGDRGEVIGVFADVEDAAVDLGVEGFDAAVEHFGEAGEVGDVADGEAGFAEGAGGSAGGDELCTVGGEGLGEGDEVGFVGNGEEGSADGFQVGHAGLILGEWRGAGAIGG